MPSKKTQTTNWVKRENCKERQSNDDGKEMTKANVQAIMSQRLHGNKWPTSLHFPNLKTSLHERCGAWVFMWRKGSICKQYALNSPTSRKEKKKVISCGSMN